MADAKAPQQVSARTGKAYQPGLGPHTESRTVEFVMSELADLSREREATYATGVRYPRTWSSSTL